MLLNCQKRHNKNILCTFLINYIFCWFFCCWFLSKTCPGFIHPPPPRFYIEKSWLRDFIFHIWKHTDDIFTDVRTKQKQLLIQLLHCASLKPHPISTMDMPRTLHIWSIILSPTSIPFSVLFLVQSSCHSLLVFPTFSPPSLLCFTLSFFVSLLPGNIIFNSTLIYTKKCINGGQDKACFYCSNSNCTFLNNCLEGNVQLTHYVSWGLLWQNMVLKTELL